MRRHAISAWAWVRIRVLYSWRSLANFFFWQVSRALLVRGHPRALSFVDRLFELFGDADVGWDAARAIGQVGTVDNVLTKRNHAIIKVVLYEILRWMLVD